MGHRIFIAINLPEKIKIKLLSCREKWPDLPVRWTKKENLHVTLEFLGYLNDEELVELCQKTKETVLQKKSFILRFNKICYGPPKKSAFGLSSSGFSTKNKTPRMIWAVGEKIKEFNITPHVTLGRIKAWEFRRLEPEEKPEINEDIDFTFEVNSIEIMESQLKRGGPEHIELESIPLKI